jgi:CRISPR-associated exonuclease Cas4
MINNYLTASDLMNYLYDPRIIYFVHVLKIPQTTTVKELKGREKYEEFIAASKRNKIIRELPRLSKTYNVYLSSEKYGFATKIDCIAIDDRRKEAYPIQVKYSYKPKVLYRSQRFQIIMEAVLIEEELGYKVPFGFIKFLKSKNCVKIAVTNNLKVELLKIFSEIENIVGKERLPKETVFKKRLVDNCYKNIY